MGIYLNPNNEGFKQSINSEIYIDKTGLVGITNKKLDSKQKYMCVSRARRFGKSMAAELIIAYYSKGCDSKELFKDYKASKLPDFEKHLNKYNVIYLNLPFFKDLESGYKNTVSNITRTLIKELDEEFPNIIAPNETMLSMALTQIYAKTSEKFIVVIDEWDCIFRESTEDYQTQRNYIDFLRTLFKDQSFIKLAYLTGIFPIKKYNTQSAMNNFIEYTMFNPRELDYHFGFTEEEVKDLCQKYNKSYNEIRQWYDGYIMPGNLHIYNPCSVVQAMTSKIIESFWTQTGTYESLKNPINMNFDGLREDIVRLMGGEEVCVDYSTFQNDMTSMACKDDILTLLVHIGYLSYNAENHTVFIPNREIKQEFATTLKLSNWQEVSKAISNSDRLIKDTIACNADAVAAAIEECHQNSTSILKYNDENSLACVITIAYYAAIKDFIVIRELPTGKGFADLVLIPKRNVNKPAMVIELKYNKTAESAIDQIKKKNYPDKIKDYTGEILLVAITYDDQKGHTCLIEQATK